MNQKCRYGADLKDESEAVTSWKYTHRVKVLNHRDGQSACALALARSSGVPMKAEDRRSRLVVVSSKKPKDLPFFW